MKKIHAQLLNDVVNGASDAEIKARIQKEYDNVNNLKQLFQETQTYIDTTTAENHTEPNKEKEDLLLLCNLSQIILEEINKLKKAKRKSSNKIIDFIDKVHNGEVTEPEIYSFITQESNNDAIYLELLRDTVEEQILTYNESISTDKINQAILTKRIQKIKGEEITIPLKWRTTIGGIKELREKHPKWSEYSLEKRTKLNESFANSEEAQNNKWATLELDVNTICNNHWELVNLNNLIWIIETIIENKRKDDKHTQADDSEANNEEITAKITPQTEYNKPRLKRKQINVLYNALQQAGATIKGNEIQKIDFCKGIEILTGYKHTQLIKDSGNSTSLILSKKKDAEEIEEVLNKALEIIKREKEQLI